MDCRCPGSGTKEKAAREKDPLLCRMARDSCWLLVVDLSLKDIESIRVLRYSYLQIYFLKSGLDLVYVFEHAVLFRHSSLNQIELPQYLVSESPKRQRVLLKLRDDRQLETDTVS